MHRANSNTNNKAIFHEVSRKPVVRFIAGWPTTQSSRRQRNYVAILGEKVVILPQFNLQERNALLSLGRYPKKTSSRN